MGTWKYEEWGMRSLVRVLIRLSSEEIGCLLRVTGTVHMDTPLTVENAHIPHSGQHAQTHGSSLN